MSNAGCWPGFEPKTSLIWPKSCGRFLQRTAPTMIQEQGWQRWQELCEKWGRKYRSFARLSKDPLYRACFTYLKYDWRIRSMIYTTNWIERLNKDFRRVLFIRSSMPDEDSVITLLGSVAMEKKAYRRKVPKLNHERTLFDCETV